MTNIEDLAVLNSKAIQFSLLDLVKLATRVDEHSRIIRKFIKEIDNFMIQTHLHSRMTKGTEV